MRSETRLAVTGAITPLSLGLVILRAARERLHPARGYFGPYPVPPSFLRSGEDPPRTCASLRIKSPPEAPGGNPHVWSVLCGVPDMTRKCYTFLVGYSLAGVASTSRSLHSFPEMFDHLISAPVLSRRRPWPRPARATSLPRAACRPSARAVPSRRGAPTGR